jgi:hypothetical protein
MIVIQILLVFHVDVQVHHVEKFYFYMIYYHDYIADAIGVPFYYWQVDILFSMAKAMYLLSRLYGRSVKLFRYLMLVFGAPFYNSTYFTPFSLYRQ